MKRFRMMLLGLALLVFPACGGILIIDEIEQPSAVDRDDDGVTDEDEWFLGTDPLDADTDWDGLFDGEEIFDYWTDPLDPDSDDDDLLDGDEIFIHDTDPNYWDSDEDGMSDGFEVWLGSDPLDYNP